MSLRSLKIELQFSYETPELFCELFDSVSEFISECGISLARNPRFDSLTIYVSFEELDDDDVDWLAEDYWAADGTVEQLGKNNLDGRLVQFAEQLGIKAIMFEYTTQSVATAGKAEMVLRSMLPKLKEKGCLQFRQVSYSDRFKRADSYFGESSEFLVPT